MPYKFLIFGITEITTAKGEIPSSTFIISFLFSPSPLFNDETLGSFVTLLFSIMEILISSSINSMGSGANIIRVAALCAEPCS